MEGSGSCSAPSPGSPTALSQPVGCGPGGLRPPRLRRGRPRRRQGRHLHTGGVHPRRRPRPHHLTTGPSPHRRTCGEPSAVLLTARLGTRKTVRLCIWEVLGDGGRQGRRLDNFAGGEQASLPGFIVSPAFVWFSPRCCLQPDTIPPLLKNHQLSHSGWEFYDLRHG